MPSVGAMEIAIVVIVALLIFGPRRLPALGRSVGEAMRELRDSVAGVRPGAERSEGGDPARGRDAAV